MGIFILGYIAAGLLAYAGSFAFWRTAYPDLEESYYKADKTFCIFISLTGYIGLIVTLILFDFYKRGLKWK